MFAYQQTTMQGLLKFFLAKFH